MSELANAAAVVAVEAASAAQSAAQVAQTADDEIEQILDSAENAIDQATRDAERIAEAAMQTHLGIQISELRGELSEWRAVREQLTQSLLEMQHQLSEQAGQISALATVEVLSQQSPMDPLLSIPPVSEAMTEAEAVIAEVLPESLGENAVPTPNAQPAPAKKRRWM